MWAGITTLSFPDSNCFLPTGTPSRGRRRTTAILASTIHGGKTTRRQPQETQCCPGNRSRTDFIKSVGGPGLALSLFWGAACFYAFVKVRIFDPQYSDKSLAISEIGQ